eukprot:Amastigsp_a847533_4.p2 type:complete len:150 gc:universal Amastigsp_a847533_4:712-263(-)
MMAHKPQRRGSEVRAHQKCAWSLCVVRLERVHNEPWVAVGGIRAVWIVHVLRRLHGFLVLSSKDANLHARQDLLHLGLEVLLVESPVRVDRGAGGHENLLRSAGMRGDELGDVVHPPAERHPDTCRRCFVCRHVSHTVHGPRALGRRAR